jgi:hypothetical protein
VLARTETSSAMGFFTGLTRMEPLPGKI